MTNKKEEFTPPAMAKLYSQLHTIPRERNNFNNMSDSALSTSGLKDIIDSTTQEGFTLEVNHLRDWLINEGDNDPDEDYGILKTGKRGESIYALDIKDPQKTLLVTSNGEQPNYSWELTAGIGKNTYSILIFFRNEQSDTYKRYMITDKNLKMMTQQDLNILEPFVLKPQADSI